MTVAPDAKRLSFEDLDDAVRALREAGLRLSTSRRLVLEALFRTDGPVSAEQLATGLGVELSAVYRNLETLERHGLVRHVHLGHGPGRYMLVGGGEHEYLYCERCGATRAVDPPQLDAVRDRIAEQFGYQARFTHFPIVGTCPACRDN
jgi:Fur family ferric uptake transcriptional regulator